MRPNARRLPRRSRRLRGQLLPGVVLLAALLLGCADPAAAPPDPLPPVEPDGHAFTNAPPAGAPAITSMSVRGGFNAWAEKAMTRQTDGSWRAVVDLPDGTHLYKFFIDGAWIADMCYDSTWGHPDHGYAVDPAADACVGDGFGGQNAVVVLGDVPLELQHDPGDPAHLSIAGGRLSVRFRARQGALTGATITPDGASAAGAVPMHRQLTVGIHEVWRATLPEATSSYAFTVETPAGPEAFGPYDVPADLFRSVPWVEGAVGYQVFPERFANGDPSNDHWTTETDEIHFRHPAMGGTQPVLTAEWDGPVLESHCCHQYFGGDLQGVIDRLDDLAGLGVDVLYLNPIFDAGSAHGYDTHDYRRVDPAFGDSAVLAALIAGAHARGMRIIWDFVPNHVGLGHHAFQDALTSGEASPYWDWFTFHVPADQVQAGNAAHYDAWWGFGSLPELRTTNPEVMEHLLDVVRGWTTFGLDGIRVDVPGDIDNRLAFFRAFRQAAKEIDPETYLVGEIWEADSSWLQGDQFDALMNYALGHGVVQRFARGDIPGTVAAREMAALYADYSEAAAAMLFNLVASHDTDRLLTMLGGGELGASPPAAILARQRLAAALLFALPGMPVTFQGDECAFLGGAAGNHTARYPVQWPACDDAMRAHYAALASLKHALDALRSPAIRAHAATSAAATSAGSPSEATSILAFLRGEPGPGEVLAVFNNAFATRSVELPDGAWTDVVTDETFTTSAPLPALGWRYLRRQ